MDNDRVTSGLQKMLSDLPDHHSKDYAIFSYLIKHGKKLVTFSSSETSCHKADVKNISIWEKYDRPLKGPSNLT